MMATTTATPSSQSARKNCSFFISLYLGFVLFFYRLSLITQAFYDIRRGGRSNPGRGPRKTSCEYSKLARQFDG
jgi:hypothetical protein